MARQFTRRVRRRTRWVAGTSAHVFSGLAAGTIGSTFITTGTAEETLIRIRGSLLAWVDGLETPGPSALIGVGLIVMPEGQGATVLTSPISDGNAPWIWISRFILGYEEMVTDVIDVPGLTSYREVVDSKAMRIIRPDRELQLVAENVTSTSALSVNIHMDARVLLQGV